MTHPHPGKRSPWISCKTPPDRYGWYEYKPKYRPEEMRLYLQETSFKGLWSVDAVQSWHTVRVPQPGDKWRGLAEEPK
jgi:hypothetical protein